MLFRSPVIVLTGSTDQATKLHALELGANDFLAKPVVPTELALRLRNTLTAKAYQDYLEHYDSATGLPNRQRFVQFVDEALLQATKEGTACAVMVLRLDQMRRVDETLGYRDADRLLAEVARRLGAWLHAKRDCDSGTRLGKVSSHEFAVLIPGLERVEHLQLEIGRAHV